MKEPVIVVFADIEQLQKLHMAFSDGLCRIVACESSANLQELISESDADIVILDLDFAIIDNQFLRNLKAESPGLSILTLSSKKLHPELRESISRYIHACLSKPLDPHELKFWLRSITQDVLKQGRPP